MSLDNLGKRDHIPTYGEKGYWTFFLFFFSNHRENYWIIKKKNLVIAILMGVLTFTYYRFDKYRVEDIKQV